MRRLASVVVAMALVVMAGGPAHAATRTYHDPKGDALYTTWIDDQTTEGSWGLDITALKVQYAHRTLHAVVRFNGLQRNSWDELDVLVKTSHHIYRLERDNGGYDQPGTGVYLGRYGQHQVCALPSHVNLAANRISMEIPASCIGTPRAIHIRAESSWTYRRVSGSDCCDDEAFDWLPDSLHGFLGPIQRGVRH